MLPWKRGWNTPVEVCLPHLLGLDQPLATKSETTAAIGEAVFVAAAGHVGELEQCLHALELRVWNVDGERADISPLGASGEHVVSHDFTLHAIQAGLTR